MSRFRIGLLAHVPLELGSSGKGPFGMPRYIGSDKNPWRLKRITRRSGMHTHTDVTNMHILYIY